MKKFQIKPESPVSATFFDGSVSVFLEYTINIDGTDDYNSERSYLGVQDSGVKVSFSSFLFQGSWQCKTNRKRL